MSRTVLSKEQMEVLPSGRSYQSLAATIPALGSSLAGRFDVGGSTQMWQGTVVAYGSQSGDMALDVQLKTQPRPRRRLNGSAVQYSQWLGTR